METAMTFKLEKVESKENRERQELWHFYEKAIEGRNNHYSQYIKFMNLYAVFTGAFFVAYYNIFDKENVEKSWFALIIALLGLGTSLLWLCSVKGYYAWIINWIAVVQHYEDLLNEGKNIKNSCFVYRLFYDIENNRDAKGCYLLGVSRFSTQKLTMLFVELIIMGWAVILCMTVYEFIKDECFVQIYYFWGVVVLLILIHLCLSFSQKLKDDITPHYKLVHEIKNENMKVQPQFTVKK